MNTEMNVPRIVITTQAAVQHEQFAKNGIQKEVHVVVKNLGFQLEVEAEGVDMNKANLVAKLIYDFDKDTDPKIEVAYVKSEPMEYKVNILDEGVRAVVELKIKVLTSQHEDMLFRIQIYGTDPNTMMPLESVSKPIKVISKVTQKKNQGTPGAVSKKRGGNHAPSVMVASPVAQPVVPDTIASVGLALARIELQQQQQMAILNFIVRKLFSGVDDLSLIAEQASLSSSQTEISSGSVPTNVALEDTADLENNFRKFLTAVNCIKPEEKQEKLSGLVSTLSTSESEKLVELLDCVSPRKRPRLENDLNN